MNGEDAERLSCGCLFVTREECAAVRLRGMTWGLKDQELLNIARRWLEGGESYKVFKVGKVVFSKVFMTHPTPVATESID